MRIAPEKQIQHWVNRLGFVLRRDLQDRFRAAGIKMGAEEWAVLLLLWQEDGQTPGALALRSVKDQTTLTRLLDGMERKGLVNRTPDMNDRRRVRVNLTAKGQGMQATLVPLAARLIEQSQRGISVEDLQITRRVLRQMTDNLLTKGD
jgi:DNA-binding MarR family transcriptional regulator